MMRVLSLWLVALGLVMLTGVSKVFANDKTELPTTSDGRRIFRCLVTFGEFQEVSVFSMSNGTFKMTTLNNAGASQAYEMPSNQWSIGKLEVPCSHDEKKTCGEVFANGRGWSYDFGSSIGDCR